MIGDQGLIRGLADSAALSCSLEAPDCFPRNFIVIDIAIIYTFSSRVDDNFAHLFAHQPLQSHQEWNDHLHHLDDFPHLFAI